MCVCVCVYIYVCVYVCMCSSSSEADDKRQCYVTVTALPPVGRCLNCSQLSANAAGLFCLFFIHSHLVQSASTCSVDFEAYGLLLV